MPRVIRAAAVEAEIARRAEQATAADVLRREHERANRAQERADDYEQEIESWRAELATTRASTLTEVADMMQGGRIPVDPATVTEVSRNAMPMALVAYVQLTAAAYLRRLAAATTTSGEQGEAEAQPNAEPYLVAELATAIEAARVEWMRPGSDLGERPLCDALAAAVLPIVHAATTTSGEHPSPHELRQQWEQRGQYGDASLIEGARAIRTALGQTTGAQP